MAKFKVNDRVRIDWSASQFHKMEAIILSIRLAERETPLLKTGELAYYLDVIGYGKFGPAGQRVVAPEYVLKPILPLGSWSEISAMLKTDIRKVRETA